MSTGSTGGTGINTSGSRRTASSRRLLPPTQPIHVHAMLQVLTCKMNDVAAIEAACATLYNLACFPQLALSFVEGGGIPRLVAVLMAHVDNAAIVETVCTVLWDLTSRDGFALTMTIVGAIPCLVDALELHAHNAAVVERATRVLWNLTSNCIDDDDYEEEDVIAAIVDAGGIPPLVVALQYHADSATIVQYVCSALSFLVDFDRSREVLRGISALVAALTRHVDNAVVVESVADVLLSFAPKDEADEMDDWSDAILPLSANEDEMEDLGGAIPSLLTALTRHADNDMVTSPVCHVLQMLAKGNASNQVAIARSGGILTLLSVPVLMHQGSEAVDILECLSIDGTSAWATVRAGGIPTLVWSDSVRDPCDADRSGIASAALLFLADRAWKKRCSALRIHQAHWAAFP